MSQYVLALCAKYVEITGILQLHYLLVVDVVIANCDLAISIQTTPLALCDEYLRFQGPLRFNHIRAHNNNRPNYTHRDLIW